MEPVIFDRHARLRAFPPAQLAYIIYRRLREHGARTTFLWVQDKILRRTIGFSPPQISQVQPLLYVGGQHKPRGLAQMRALGITAVVNMREESDDAQRGVALDHYLWLPTTDDTPPTTEDLERGVAFITEQIAAGRGVYIHCAAGVGRAPAMAIAYLISTGMSMEQAWAAVREARPFIRMTPPQIETLAAFGASRQSQASADIKIDVSSAQTTFATRASTVADADVNAQVRAAMERIAEDPTLTADLTDAEARVVLKWAQQEVERLITEANAQDGATLDSVTWKLHHLRRYIRRTAQVSAASEHPLELLHSLLTSPLTYPDNVNDSSR